MPDQHEFVGTCGEVAYDSDPLDVRLRRRRKVERLNAWLQHSRHVLVRQDYHLDNFRGFVLLMCMRILLRRL